MGDTTPVSRRLYGMSNHVALLQLLFAQPAATKVSGMRLRARRLMDAKGRPIVFKFTKIEKKKKSPDEDRKHHGSDKCRMTKQTYQPSAGKKKKL
ncbi:hypothetical protein BB8028_0001g16520 [Beauveria bassiana]|uniref:Uncharacterized protein n=1 Tax=Beauveria bassiana TaxID=176275 RepID=A0A2S7Y0Y2_BEABA|nr:hypothetical protein BB8028_0001g16520 [Beauveria bassiana]